ncbi:class III lanthionine synthetase LanKC [Streptomyces mobaraensis NBRC 13819 = DSM 40847]|uniref:non-specific serine/threonine protein kinase n=2 Tax=Streptomyces mobaraensis TaxID=35621 RepID=A0A5N5W9R5_STRMB|nr:class III lanthionine synthetase LanKC [Streptomyces mobaraensis]EMF01465.1 membrane translocator [Streptomyces mobaraensis NBRC 13819 = DSM 40847]KAB7847249.1 lantipeptide synthetase [Streptomyces mobaraensis]QTT76793.1 class III lanthionine synthetase LanKC [Streptomyces mobaraensis NBRC 13819 = DSM 40847]
MDKRYEVYSLADRHFYETPDRLPTLAGTTTEDGLFETARRPVPDGWATARSGDWLNLFPAGPDGGPLPGQPLQGWKIHVSATAGTADKTAADVWDYCVPRGIPFKFVPGPHQLHLRNTKYAGRDHSGKFVTVYPADEEQLRTTLEELDALLGGRPGPYILTDLRWNAGPLYVRYGAFARRFCVGERGTLVPAVEDGTGRLVPDSRDPAFRVPSWVTLPAFLEPHLAARNATTVADLPYRIEKALHFSNGGGVYRGTDTRDGRKVVLKEGRPYAGLAADGADAVARLERERDALERLAGLDAAPGYRDWFTLGEHSFLVMDFVEGRPLNSFFAERHPLLAAEPDPAAVAAYTAWALRIHRAVEEAVEAVHSRGLVFNDLHMFNIMVAPDERSVTLIDFEAAAPASEHGRQVVAHPGFFAPPDRRGRDVDRYALACLRLALFLPVTTLFVIDREQAAHLAEVIAAQFPGVPREFLDEAVAEITREAGAAAAGAARAARPSARPPRPGDWPASRDSMVRALLASATPERDDRLFPGDIAQFGDGGGLGLAHGAAGVLYALEEAGAPRYEAGERWLLDHTDPLPPGTPLGLYDGVAGAALVLDRLGHTGRALDLTEAILRENWQRLSSDLRGGLSGLGLLLDHLAGTTGDTALREHALRAARILADRLTADDADGGEAAGGRQAGLLRGATGPALLFLRLYDRTGAPDLLDLAGRALRADLARCVTTGNGTLEVDEGWRTMPYVGDGSVGIGMVLDDFLAAAGGEPDPALAAARDGITAAARSRFYAQPGLFQGRAGMVLHLARTTAPGVTPGQVAAQIDALDWYAMGYRGELAFPGHQMMRLSMDLATGTAGCLLALAAARGDRPARLPFLPPLPPAPPAGP